METHAASQNALLRPRPRWRSGPVNEWFNVTAISVHEENGGLSYGIGETGDVVTREGDLGTIGRPHRIARPHRRVIGELQQPRAVSVHNAYLFVPLTLAGEGDPRCIGRPCWIVVRLGVLGQSGQVRPVDTDDEQVAGARENDFIAVRRPRGRGVVRSQMAGQVYKTGTVRVYEVDVRVADISLPRFLRKSDPGTIGRPARVTGGILLQRYDCGAVRVHDV